MDDVMIGFLVLGTFLIISGLFWGAFGATYDRIHFELDAMYPKRDVSLDRYLNKLGDRAHFCRRVMSVLCVTGIVTVGMVAVVSYFGL